MKYWEFLIQKEGDQTWLPLETQQVEILEGRYRVVAHTDRANTAMEIRVSQLITTELPPRQRVRKRIAQTNEAGLVVVMPFVNLKPGRWKLTCSGVETDSWQYSVQLQVFAHTEEDWSGEWPVPEDSETTAGVILEDDENGSPVDLELVNRDLPLLQAQAELETRLQSQGLITADAGLFSDADKFSYRVSLRQQAYLAHHDQPMTIMGKVNALSERVIEKTSQLWIRLQNPETAQVIMEAHRPLSLARLPADFKVQIQLPTEVATRVILGEVSLRTAALDPAEKVEVLASTAFTITAGIAQLLDTIANQDLGAFEEEISVLLGTQSALASSGAGREPVLIDASLSTASFNSMQTSFVPAVGVVLPPLLDLNELRLNELRDGSDASQLDLPNFATPVDTAANLIVSDGPSAPPPAPTAPIERPPMVSQPAQFLGTSIEDGDLEADEIAAVLEDIDQDLRLEASALDALEPAGIEGLLPSTTISKSTIISDSAIAESDVTESAARALIQQPGGTLETLSDDVQVRLAASKAARQAARQADRDPLAQPAEVRSRQSNGLATNRPAVERRQSAQQVEASIDFQALKLKDHFWNRLSTLTHESHKEATQISQRMKDAGVSRGQSSMLSAVSSFDQDSEVVIYDEPSQSAAMPQQRLGHQGDDVSQQSGRSMSAANGTAQSTIGQSTMGKIGQSRPMIAQEDLPEMALPVISVPMGDLVAGEIITVTVRTRPAVFKPFIKLWMIDRQSRSLVIEPQLLTNLMPDALGDLEATTEMQIPMDCLDVQIAAIAVDMATQQESSKAIVNRHVVPANQASSRGFSL